LIVGHAERRVTRIKDKENNSEGKQVNDLSLVGLFRKNFRSHVAGGAHLGMIIATSVTAFKGASEAEINDFDIKVFVQKNILWFEIAMRKAFGVDVVHTLQHLIKEVLANRLREGT